MYRSLTKSIVILNLTEDREPVPISSDSAFFPRAGEAAAGPSSRATTVSTVVKKPGRFLPLSVRSPSKVRVRVSPIQLDSFLLIHLLLLVEKSN